MYHHKYICSKHDYLILINQQVGGKQTPNKGLDLDPELELKDNTKIRFTFTPTLCILGDDEYCNKDQFIKSTKHNLSKMNEFIKSDEYHLFYEYCFDDLRPFIIPHYTPEMYFIKDPITKISKDGNNIIIIITGTIKKRSYDYVRKQYEVSKNSSFWTDKNVETFKVKHFIDGTKESFYKDTQEGEIHIPGIGQLMLDDNTKMSLEIL